jgi:hypothetical protein
MGLSEVNEIVSPDAGEGITLPRHVESDGTIEDELDWIKRGVKSLFGRMGVSIAHMGEYDMRIEFLENMRLIKIACDKDKKWKEK